MNLYDIPEDKRTLIKGKLTEFIVVPARENLLESINKKNRRGALASAATATLDPGLMACASMVANYDGEDTQKFIGYLDGLPIYGQFDGANEIPTNDTLEAVVVREGQVLWVCALLAPRRGWCWTHRGVSGKLADKASHHSGLHFLIFGVLAGAFIAPPLFATPGASYGGFIMLGTGFGMGLLMYLWNLASPVMGGGGEEVEDYRLLSFDEPDNIDLTDYESWSFGPDFNTYGFNGAYDVRMYQNLYMYRRAIQAGVLKRGNESSEIPEYQQRLIEGPISDIVTYPTTASTHFSDPMATDDAMVHSTEAFSNNVPFLAKIGGQPVCGSSHGIYTLEEGDHIRASVCDCQSVTVVKAMTCEAKDLLLSPALGEIPQRNGRYIFSFYVSLAGNLLIQLIAWIVYTDNPEMGKYLFFSGLCVGLTASIGYTWYFYRRPNIRRIFHGRITSIAWETLGFTKARRAKLSKFRVEVPESLKQHFFRYDTSETMFFPDTFKLSSILKKKMLKRKKVKTKKA